MNRITHECLQGTQDWLDLRAKYFTASELAAAAGESKYQTRSALLKAKATGVAEEVDAAKQRLFDAGHAAEAAARPIVENIIGAELYPVTMSVEIDGLPLLASLDGIDMLGDVIWENKLRSDSLVEQVNAGRLDPHYTYQIEQQLLVSGASRCYFTTSDGTPEGTFGMWYESNPEIRAKVVSVWKQFAKDLAEFQHPEVVAAPVAEKVEGLPALFVQVEGRVVASNMDAFKGAAELFISRLPKADQLKTDQDFVNADQAAKDCKDAEERLQVVKAQAQSQAVSIDEAFRAIDIISEKIRAARLSLERCVKAEKENRKAEIVTAASKELFAHMQSLRQRVGGYMPTIEGGFAEAIKGLKSLDSMRDKVSVALANAKIEANALADRIDANRKTVEDMSLLPDFAQVCTKAPDDFAALLAMRINARKESEEKRLAAERERIRAEEQVKAQREIAAANQMQFEQNNQPPATTKGTAETPLTGNQETAPQGTGPTIKLGEICARLGFTVSADFLASLGFDPVATDKNAKLYREDSFKHICAGISAHVLNIGSKTMNLAA